ncbi:ATP-binding protein [Sinimarinibacterium sp. NLF-5-8]|uniref:ATP-binding protein n=1 Tax=Sinimarinibacterium sp. NLF-5-8 TaxID=2698684 RepID=UPI00137C359B|nr:ATP-binding protein [Sinimarinibacterium sp. NLF-5-8]QHS09823.1 response regulator [Sinimarinibacterium sp. NLF-5-8]
MVLAAAMAVVLAAALALVWAQRRQRQRLRALHRYLSALNQGRTEHRLSDDLGQALRPIVEQCNRLAQHLDALHSDFDNRVAAHTQRLNQERQALGEQNQTLRSAAARAQDEARAQSDLLASLSHELRTPLTGILGYADLLQRTHPTREQAQHLQTLQVSARALLSMINDLLDFSRIEAGRLHLNEEPLDLIDAIDSTCALLAPLAYDKQLELVRIVYHDVPRQIHADGQRIRQILTNLLSNAIKFTARGEVVLRVMREQEHNGRTLLRFSISDTGIGLSADAQARLFQPFRQFSRNTQNGSGLGLSIVHKLTELMGGEVTLESTPGKGSTFSVILPCKLMAAAESSARDGTDLAQRSVWLLEPHPTSRLALEHWLQFWGLRIKGFERPEDLETALLETRNTPAALPDLVIACLKPREVDDPGVQEILGSCANGTPPLLALLASASPQLHQRVIDSGARACAAKVIGRRALYEQLLSLIQGQPAAASNAPLHGQRALVVDNNIISRRYMVSLCQQLGLRADQAEDGLDALRQWQHRRHDIVILDARMPGLDGAGCAQQIRRLEHGSGQRCTLIAASAHLEPEQRQRFLRAGADAILIKPFDARALLAKIQPDGALPAAAKLTTDPELLALLLEELPLQWQALDAALREKSLTDARDAVHTLRGTAAFYHLAALRQASQALERWLLDSSEISEGIHIRREVINVRRAVDQTLDALQGGAD